ncbi:MAG: hypothetical protein ACRENU_14595 [Gemmatimonadaceae bacterium]
MPVTLSFTEPSTFVLDACGDLTYAECRDALAQLAAHPKFSGNARVLADGRSVTRAPATDELRALVQHLQPLAERGVRTMGILTETPAVYGVARMFAVFAELLRFEVPVFRSHAEAQRWLEGDADSGAN